VHESKIIPTWIAVEKSGEKKKRSGWDTGTVSGLSAPERSRRKKKKEKMGSSGKESWVTTEGNSPRAGRPWNGRTTKVRESSSLV